MDQDTKKANNDYIKRSSSAPHTPNNDTSMLEYNNDFVARQRPTRSHSLFAKAPMRIRATSQEVFHSGGPKGYDSLLKTTTRVLEWMSGDVHIKRLVDLVVEGVYDLVPSERVTLYFADNSKKELWIAVAKDDAVKRLRLPFGVGIAGKVAQTGQLFKTDNCYDDKQFNKTVDKQTGFRSNNMVCVPICSYKTGETLGVFSAINRIRKPRSVSSPTPVHEGFDETDCRLLTIFALQISVALRKCTLQLALEKMAIDNALMHEHDRQLLDARVALLKSFASPRHKKILRKNKPARLSGYVPARPVLKSWPSSLKGGTDIRTRIMRWDLDSRSLTNKEIRHYAEFMLLDMCYPNDSQVVKSRIKPFITAVADGYHEENAFHNLHHGFSVMHMTYMQLKTCAEQLPETLTPMHAFGMLIAAFCHDLDHPGVNDVFLVNANHPISWGKTLGDGILERHHCRKTFEILAVESNNVIGHLKGSQYKRMRKVIIDAIMATDMAKHMRYVKQGNDLVTDWHEDPPLSPAASTTAPSATDNLGPFHPNNMKLDSNLQLLIDIMVHCSDLSGQALPWHLADKWGKCCNMEFHQQFIQERKRGLPETSFMKNLDQPLSQYNGQLFFVRAVVIPLWELAAKLLPGLKHMLQNCKNNITKYEVLKKEEEAKAAAKAEADAVKAAAESPLVELQLPRVVPPVPADAAEATSDKQPVGSDS